MGRSEMTQNTLVIEPLIFRHAGGHSVPRPFQWVRRLNYDDVYVKVLVDIGSLYRGARIYDRAGKHKLSWLGVSMR